MPRSFFTVPFVVTYGVVLVGSAEVEVKEVPRSFFTVPFVVTLGVVLVGSAEVEVDEVPRSFFTGPFVVTYGVVLVGSNSSFFATWLVNLQYTVVGATCFCVTVFGHSMATKQRWKP